MKTTAQKPTTPESNKRSQSAAKSQSADRTAKTAKKAARFARAKYKAAKEAFKKARKEAKKAARQAKRARKEHMACLAHVPAKAACPGKRMPSWRRTPKKAFKLERKPRRTRIEETEPKTAAADIAVAQPVATTQAPDSSTADA